MARWKQPKIKIDVFIPFNSYLKRLWIVIQISFKWVEGGSVVYVTGTFTNWRNHILMNRVINEFHLVLVRVLLRKFDFFFLKVSITWGL